MAAEITSVSGTEKTLNRLETIYQQYQQALNDGDVDEFLRLNKEFHYTIYRDANMPILQEMIDSLWYRISPYLHILNRKTERLEPRGTIKYHRGMLEGMKHRDPGEVLKWLRTDLTEAAKLVIEKFEQVR